MMLCTYYTIMDSCGGKDGLIQTKQTNIDQDKAEVNTGFPSQYQHHIYHLISLQLFYHIDL